MRTHLAYLLFCLAVTIPNALAADAPLDQSLAPKSEEEVSNVFRDMGVVQKRAMPKADRWLLSSFMTMDFSDGPYSNYSFHVNPGYAINDFFEVYANFVPFYIVSPRSIHEKIAPFGLSIVAARPKMQYGIEVLWAPLYGKDSLGISRVIRSDTFVKFNASMISFEGGDSGMSFRLGVGKTFFLTKSAGFRFCIDWGYVQSLIGAGAVGTAATLTKGFSSMLLTEFGMTFYL